MIFFCINVWKNKYRIYIWPFFNIDVIFVVQKSLIYPTCPVFPNLICAWYISFLQLETFVYVVIDFTDVMEHLWGEEVSVVNIMNIFSMFFSSKLLTFVRKSTLWKMLLKLTPEVSSVARWAETIFHFQRAISFPNDFTHKGIKTYIKENNYAIWKCHV